MKSLWNRAADAMIPAWVSVIAPRNTSAAALQHLPVSTMEAMLESTPRSFLKLPSNHK
jgi:hypothetical protein